MDASLQTRAEQLAGEMASQARTAEDLNGLMRLMMKSALERMLNTEMDVHLGRKTRPRRTATELLAESPLASEPASPAAEPETLAEPSQRAFPQDGARRPGRIDHRHAARSQRHVRAAIDRQAPAAPAGLRREDSGAVRQGDDHPRHSRDRAGAVRRRGLADADLGNHRRPRRRGDGLADAAAGGGLADRVLRRHRGACARRQRPGLAAHDLRGNRRESRRATRSCWACGWPRTKGPSSGSRA